MIGFMVAGILAQKKSRPTGANLAEKAPSRVAATAFFL
jgi:hypothetical protein